MNRIIASVFCLVSLVSMSQIPTTGLTSYYPFIGNADDQSGNNFDGTVNGATLSNDRFGFTNKAYEFNGSNDHIVIPHDSALKPDLPFTISLWFKIDRLGSTSSIIYASDESFNRYSGFWIGYLPSGTISAGYGNGQGQSSGNRVTKVSNTAVNTSSWHNVIAVYHGLNDIDLYIDCNFDPGYYSGSAYSMNSGTNNSVIGRSFGHTLTAYHNGKIDDIRLYDVAIDPEGIIELCNEGRDSSLPKLTSAQIALYPNPSAESITIVSNLTQSNKIENISIRDINGKLMKKVSTEANTIDIRTLPAGVYFVNVTVNQQTVTKKFVKQ